MGAGVRRSVTLRDVANEVGLSVSAVSMALQDHPRIGADAKLRVQAAADRLGYVANTAGRALRARQAGAVALVVPNTGQHVFGHPYFMRVLDGVTSVANANDLHVLISTNPDEQHGRVAYDRVLRSGSVDGAILTSAAIDDRNIDRIVRAGLPIVLLGRYPYLRDAVSVGIDDRAAERRLTEHLILEHGRRHLVHISGPLDHQAGVDRRDGFVEACAAHGTRGTVIEGDFSEGAGAAATGRVLGDMPETDGIVAANDEMALGAMVVLRSAGRRVPVDLSLVGFDDFGISRVTTPSITTVHVPAERMARLATERLLDLVRGRTLSPEDAHTVLEVDLVRRDSCGCAPRLDLSLPTEFGLPEGEHR
jgi:DNA-binding LacI/PurR family transcriptional regulator